jgi:threonine aldolase
MPPKKARFTMTISDFRSDTVTKPTPEMRKAMAEAEVGDDVIGFDPTVQKLEALAAATMGKEAGLFCPSGTMGNSIAVKAWTRELQEVIVESRSHIFNLESTHLTFVSRVTPRPLPSRRGAMDPGEVERNVRKPNVHTPQTSLICLENTHNNWGGAVVPLENFKAIRRVADRHGLKVHLDGARLFNASTASGIPVLDYAREVDSVMFCLSKGLSAPVGSMLAGPKDFIEYGRRIRKALGGGMRQAGVLAAPGIIALTDMTGRLGQDHARAKKLAQAIAGLPGVSLEPAEVETNIIIFGLAHPRVSIGGFLAELGKRKVMALAPFGGVRMVTHKDIDDEDVDRAIVACREILS